MAKAMLAMKSVSACAGHFVVLWGHFCIGHCDQSVAFMAKVMKSPLCHQQRSLPSDPGVANVVKLCIHGHGDGVDGQLWQGVLRRFTSLDATSPWLCVATWR